MLRNTRVENQGEAKCLHLFPVLPLPVSPSCTVDPGYVTSISRADQSSLERRVNFSELVSPSGGPLDTTNVTLYQALKSVIEWTGEVCFSWGSHHFERDADFLAACVRLIVCGWPSQPRSSARLCVCVWTHFSALKSFEFYLSSFACTDGVVSLKVSLHTETAKVLSRYAFDLICSAYGATQSLMSPSLPSNSCS